MLSHTWRQCLKERVPSNSFSHTSVRSWFIQPLADFTTYTPMKDSKETSRSFPVDKLTQYNVNVPLLSKMTKYLPLKTTNGCSFYPDALAAKQTVIRFCSCHVVHSGLFAGNRMKISPPQNCISLLSLNSQSFQT